MFEEQNPGSRTFGPMARRGLLVAAAAGAVSAVAPLAVAAEVDKAPVTHAEVGAANGVASLDGSARVPSPQLPLRTATSSESFGMLLQTEFILNVYDHGVAMNPGTVDSTAQLQAVIDKAGALTANQTRHVTVTIPHGFVSAAAPNMNVGGEHGTDRGVILSNPMVSLVGPGELRGTITVGEVGKKTAFSGSIMNLRIAPPGGANGIILQGASRIRITGCTFSGCDAAVYIYPVPPIQAMDQLTSRVTIDHNRFDIVNYALRSENHKDNSGNTDVSWMALADVAFEDNIVNDARVAHVRLESVDGAIISRNQLFFPSAKLADGSNKSSCIIVGTSNWLVISDNHLFEAGSSAIDLTNPQSVTITGNHLAWPGSRVLSPAITIARSAFNTSLPLRGLIDNNTAIDYSGSAIQFSGLLDFDQFIVGGGNLFSSYVKDDNKRAYVGSATVPWPHPRVVVLDGAAPRVNMPASVRTVPNQPSFAEVDVLPGGKVQSLHRLGSSSAVSSVSKTVAAVAGSPVVVAYLASADGQETYGGMILVEVRAKQNVSRSPSSQYLLLVSKHGWMTSSSPGQLGYSCQVIKSIEMGTMVEGNPSKPVFDFTLDAQGLGAQPRVGATPPLEFIFSFITMGNVVATS